MDINIHSKQTNVNNFTFSPLSYKVIGIMSETVTSASEHPDISYEDEMAVVRALIDEDNAKIWPHIRAIDQIVKGGRNSHVMMVRDIKKRHGKPTVDPAREADIVRGFAQKCAEEGVIPEIALATMVAVIRHGVALQFDANRLEQLRARENEQLQLPVNGNVAF